MKVRPIVLLACLAFLMLAGGCWDAVNVEDSAYVSMMGFDTELDAEPELQISLDITIPRLVEGISGTAGDAGDLSQRPGFVATSRGETVQLAERAAQDTIPRDVRFVQMRAIILGGDLARSGRQLDSILNWTLHHPELRLDTIVFVSESTAHELLAGAGPSLEQILGIEAERFLDLQRFAGRAARITLREFTEAHYSPFRDPMAPVLTLIDPVTGTPRSTDDGSQGLQALRVRGMGLFRDGRLVGMWSEPALRGAMWVHNGVLGDVSLRLPLESGDASPGYAAVTLRSVRTQRFAEYNDGDGLTLGVSLDVKAGLMERDSVRPITDREVVTALEARLASAMEVEIRAALTETQNLRVDPFAFAKRLYEREPQTWHAIKDDWRTEYERAQVEVHVTASITRVGIGR